MEEVVVGLAIRMLLTVLTVAAIGTAIHARQRRSTNSICFAGGVSGTALLAYSVVLSWGMLEDRRAPQNSGHYHVGSLPNSVFVTLGMAGLILIGLSLATFAIALLRSDLRKAPAKS